MMKHIEKVAEYNAGVVTYMTGFVLSLVLTLASFGLVWRVTETSGSQLSRGAVIGLLVVLASLQLVVQIVYFLHMSTERKARWTMLSGAFAVMVVLILVIGSIWVMNNLNYNMMPHDSTKYMQEKENLHDHQERN